MFFLGKVTVAMMEKGKLGTLGFSNRMRQYREAFIDVLGVDMVQYPHYMLLLSPFYEILSELPATPGVSHASFHKFIMAQVEVVHLLHTVGK